jgi:tetratricopeptide (TPR) repeat protein
MVISPSRRPMLWVAFALPALFAFTASLDSAYRAARRSRAGERYRNGLVLERTGRHQEAAAEFRAALTFAHTEPAYRLALARSLVEMGRLKEAESHLSELREQDPIDGTVNLMLARIAARDHRPEDAITWYHRAIYGYWSDRAPESRLAARFELVDYLTRHGQSKQIVAELLELAGDAPESDLAARERVGRLLLRYGSPEHAAEIFRGIVDAEPRGASAQEGLGEAEFALGNFTAARAAFRMAQRLGFAEPFLARRIEACDAVLDLDPTLVHLTAGQRYARARELVRLALEASRTCWPPPPDLADAAAKALSQNPARRREGETVEFLGLAQGLWKARPADCGPGDALGALPAIMARLQRQ